MELKPQSLRGWRPWYPPFNRTTMELKLSDACLGSMPAISFNRTTMELKHLSHHRRPGILPTFNRTTMELKRLSQILTNRIHLLLIEPLWNWNGFCLSLSVRRLRAFNRTTMELKLGWTMWVLSIKGPFTFNRTTMELKPPMARSDSAVGGRAF